MELSRPEIKLIVSKDLMFKSPLWAMIILLIWGAISFIMFWVLLTIIKPSIDRRVEAREKNSLPSIIEENENRMIKHADIINDGTWASIIETERNR